jgi:uncharacterized MnhB-related membrane protein
LRLEADCDVADLAATGHSYPVIVGGGAAVGAAIGLLLGLMLASDDAIPVRLIGAVLGFVVGLVLERRSGR